jgi:hypothetical protein
MFHRAILFLIATVDGALFVDREWGGACLGLALALWLVLDDRAVDRLDPDRPSL